MTEKRIDHNPPPGGMTFAPLKNVSLMLNLVQRLKDRGPHLPGLGVLFGFSGYGKTYAAIYAQLKTRGPRIEIGDSWTRRTLLRALMRELGVHEPKGTVADLAEQAIERLATPGHPPVFIDEADKLVDKGMIELVREIHEASQCPIVLIGEEALPQKLTRSERTHNRVLEWAMAQPCDLDDARHLARIFAPGLDIEETLLERIRASSEGRARRIVVNLSRVAEWARVRGSKLVEAGAYDQDIVTGTPPVRRSLGRAA